MTRSVPWPARWALGAGVLLGAFVLLAIPAGAPDEPDAPAGAAAFAWNRDSLWDALASAYVTARGRSCLEVERAAGAGWTAVTRLLDALSRRPADASDPALDSLERVFFELAPAVAACPAGLREFGLLSARARDVLKEQSRRWAMDDVRVRHRLYRSLYGMRAAVEEVMLQHPDSAVPLLAGRDEPSATPAALVHGVRVHSGDILVSRGGYPTSALIARGSDYPGNFSHIGLVHVDAVTGTASVIEAHIESGVAVTTAEGYLRDKKLRVMVLRPRADLPAIATDPLLPHRAATLALTRARAGHIPYDFAMDYTDPSRLFCSEVASSAYAELGVILWMGLSTISRPGLRRWLAGFGVRHFTTQEPSDLEYDPQLVVVAEWRDAADLLRDHVDNAVVDAMLERADAGDDVPYGWHKLPAARLAKAYSWVRVALRGRGPIPEGMSAAAALRHDAFVVRQRAIASRVRAAVAARTTQLGYVPPYWELVAIARTESARP